MRNKLGILLISLHMKLYCYADYASKWVCQLSRNIVALGVVRCTWLARCHLVEVVTTVSMLEKPTPIHHINHGHRGPISCLAVNIAIIIISIATVFTTIAAVIDTTETIMIAVVANVTIRAVKSHTGGPTYGDNDQQLRVLRLPANKSQSTGEYNIHRLVNSIMHATRNCYIWFWSLNDRFYQYLAGSFHWQWGNQHW